MIWTRSVRNDCMYQPELREETMKRRKNEAEATEQQKPELQKQYRAIGPAALAAALVCASKRKTQANNDLKLPSGYKAA